MIPEKPVNTGKLPKAAPPTPPPLVHKANGRKGGESSKHTHPASRTEGYHHEFRPKK